MKVSELKGQDSESFRPSALITVGCTLAAREPAREPARCGLKRSTEFMHVSDGPNPRPGDKRSYPEDLFTKKDWILRPQKRLKTNTKSETHHRPTFWDRLSEVKLTKRALVELNRQSSDSSPPPTHIVQFHTRRLSLNEFARLKHFSPDEAARMKRLSRLGGPDLRDLTGVSVFANGLSLSIIYSIHDLWREELVRNQEVVDQLRGERDQLPVTQIEHPGSVILPDPSLRTESAVIGVRANSNKRLVEYTLRYTQDIEIGDRRIWMLLGQV
jgi:hypothetical protein